MAVEPIRPIGPRPDVAGVERVRLTQVQRDEQRRERDQRRKRPKPAPEPPAGDGHEGIDVRA